MQTPNTDSVSSNRTFLPFYFFTVLLFYSSIYIGVATLVSCNNPQAPDFIQSTGKDKTEERLLPASIRHIDLQDNIDLVLLADTGRRLRVTGGGNLLPDVTTELDAAGILTIRNRNTFRWVRSYKPIRVEVPAQGLTGLRHTGTGTVTCPDTLDTFFLDIKHYGTSNCTVLVRTGRVAVDANGSCTLTLAGRVGSAYLGTMKLARLDARHLKARTAQAECRGAQPLYCQATDSVAAYIRNRGNIVVYGQPKYFIEKKGSGNVLFR